MVAQDLVLYTLCNFLCFVFGLIDLAQSCKLEEALNIITSSFFEVIVSKLERERLSTYWILLARECKFSVGKLTHRNNVSALYCLIFIHSAEVFLCFLVLPFDCASF